VIESPAFLLVMIGRKTFVPAAIINPGGLEYRRFSIDAKRSRQGQKARKPRGDNGSTLDGQQGLKRSSCGM